MNVKGVLGFLLLVTGWGIIGLTLLCALIAALLGVWQLWLVIGLMAAGALVSWVGMKLMDWAGADKMKADAPRQDVKKHEG